MWTIFEIGINCFQGFLLIYFMSKRLPTQQENRWWVDILFELLGSLYLCLYLLPSVTISDTTIFLIPFCYAIVTKRGTWLERVLWTITEGVLFTSVTVLMGFLYTSILNVDPTKILRYGVLRIGYVITTNIALTVALVTVAHVGKSRQGNFLSKSSLRIFLGLLLMQFLAIELLHVNQFQVYNSDSILIVINVCMFVVVLLTLLLYEVVAQSAQSKHLAELRLQTMLLTQQHQDDVTAMYKNMIATQHDIRHQINVTKQLLSQDNTVDREIILSLLPNDSQLSNEIITGCIAVDAILTAKRAIAEENGIAFVLKPYPLQKLPINVADFCVLLSNLLDNAIEASMRIEDDIAGKKHIEISFARSWEMFYLSCSNGMNSKTIRRSGDNFLTSKESTQMHGYGIINMKQLVARNKGYFEIEVNDTEFRVNITFPDKEESDVA